MDIEEVRDMAQMIYRGDRLALERKIFKKEQLHRKVQQLSSMRASSSTANMHPSERPPN